MELEARHQILFRLEPGLLVSWDGYALKINFNPVLRPKVSSLWLQLDLNCSHIQLQSELKLAVVRMALKMYVESIERLQSKINDWLHAKVGTMHYVYRVQNPSTTCKYALGTLGTPSEMFCTSSLFASFPSMMH